MSYHACHPAQEYSEANAQADAVASFMEELGIDLAEEREFGWIAELGLQTPLPPKWSTCLDPSTGYMYFIDNDTQTSSWENPLLPYLRRVVEIGREHLEAPAEDFFEQHRDILWQEHLHDLRMWSGPFNDFTGRHYYVNS